ncbi:uncharacterized protein LOC120260096 [Dioscorea cayenensis subsp. rotundata]|uniref:Uncharacterized protein LOC120260096 n=1 Tax=Dioscorea cayennensis subsp. rotundata TaxID=55577 RepID=A0AB40B8B3_DIOCR|nr:uncharacterized protein LOC120260096 [Dioscorea cayenensis subsp. rotundata]
MDEIIESRRITLVDGEPMTYIHHFHVEIFATVIDEVAEELNNRFNEANTNLLKGVLRLDPSNNFARFDHHEILHLARLYFEDFSTAELAELHYQLELYIDVVRGVPDFYNLVDVGALAIKMVKHKYHICFPLVYRLIELALVLPIATATVERCFSTMNVVKTDLRN